MLKIWRLVLFCGLLTQSSAYPKRHKPILTHPHPKVSVQAEASARASLLLKTATSLHSQLLSTNTPRNLKKLSFMKAVHAFQDGLLGNLHAGVDAKLFVREFSSIKVIEAQIFDINITQSEDRHQLLATFPTTLDMEANIKFLGNIGFIIEVNNKFQIGIEMDENEDGYLVIQNCNTDFVSSQVKTHSRVLNSLLDGFTSVLNAVVPELVEEALCSAVSTCLPKLGVKLKTALVDALICGYDLSVN
ncbi:BPI fold-containing family A member 1-like [Phascolarctos cinereus]|uniref:BPI fold-containing family A member 1-like n=1 Tax=Phascolarctos cinereus TaxID=38626 RepID=A0A6P5KML4_PHACI|nr:BPI fold-containing family A member 1-like [Phascolarctos cinereus]